MHLGDIAIGNFSVIHVGTVVVRFGKIIAIEAKILRVRVCAEAAARAVIFDNVNNATHAVKI